jgi:hypothetical protein
MTEFSELAPLWWPGMLAMGCLILASGFFSASETAFFYLTRDQIRNFGSGKPRQQMVAALLSDPDRLLTAVLFWNLVINLSYFAISVVIAHRLSAAARVSNCRERIQTTEKPSRKRHLAQVDMSCFLQQRSVGRGLNGAASIRQAAAG